MDVNETIRLLAQAIRDWRATANNEYAITIRRYAHVILKWNQSGGFMPTVERGDFNAIMLALTLIH